MANKSKKAVKAELRTLGVEFTTDDYRELCELLSFTIKLKPPAPAPTAVTEPTQVRITNRRKRLKNMFLADAVRDQDDRDFLNKEISQRKYKGKLKTITTIKHYDVIDGDWVTSFIIDLKE